MISLPKKLVKPALLALAAVLFVGVSFTQKQLNARRGELGLTRITPLENAPPVLAFTTVALGGFRGLIANALWVRLSDLQENDKYFEMVQLADWITKLQPHFVAVWVHLAWNMSYNISVKFNTLEDRWNWVRRGIELLRDEGLRYNPGEPLLYRELAWHFQHKMGQNLDDAHHAYKYIWAREMTAVLGSGKVNFDELINPQTDEARERARVLREKFKMDPAEMKAVDAEYGPLEWRLPETHAIYWAMLGMKKTRGDKLKQEELVQLRRVIFQSMQLAFHRGRMVFPRKGSDQFIFAPNLDIIRRANKAYEDMIADEPNQKDHLAIGHRNFLKTAVYFLYTYNRIAAADEWFKYLRQKFPGAIPEHESLDDFALARIGEEMGETSQDKTKALLEGLITSSFLNLAMGEDDRAVSYELMARRVWNRYTQETVISDKRIALPPLEEIKNEILRQLLDPTPEAGLEPQLAAQLRTKLGLPAEAVDASTVLRPAPAPGAPGATNTVRGTAGAAEGNIK